MRSRITSRHRATFILLLATALAAPAATLALPTGASDPSAPQRADAPPISSVWEQPATPEPVIIVTTPEPTAIADAYATLKALTAGSDLMQPHILVNQSESPEQAREIIGRVQQTARTFLHLTVSSAGHIPRDPAVVQAVARRQPFAAANTRTPAGLAIEQLARRLVNLSQPSSDQASFFQQFSQWIDRPVD